MLTFEPNNSEQEDSENDGDDNEQESQEEDEFQADHAADADAPEPQVKKKLALHGPREFKEVDRWDRSDSTNEDIIVFVRRHLDECNQNAGIQHLPGKHKDRKNI